MDKFTIFIDESGTLPDVKDKVIVIAAVSTNTPVVIDQLFKTLKKKGDIRKQTGELKFYTAGDKTKQLFFEKITKEDFEIFILEVEKMGRKIPDTPEHFALLCWLLLNDVFSFYQDIKEIIFDRHFSRDYDTLQFDKSLRQLLPKLPVIHHVDSKEVKRVNVADMIAGAVLANETGKNDKYYKMLAGQIISEKRINWVEAKRKFINKKLV
ncbi:DUF3800 domain-containing protein [Candidatus Daviesbacteria bacterium]|nr:DUF3800 domain-containing protein [Candidatus Daviesbacteria bacterium]